MVGPVQSEKRLLWHPRRDNKFVVGGGSQITLYEWAPDYPEIRHVTSQHDLQFMRCFAWSPDPAYDDFMAVGLSTGRVDLLRLEASKHARRNNVLSSGPSVSLPVRNSRSCNALAFCTADPNYLAVGLDKVRGDCSLVIWDLTTTAAALSISVSPNDVSSSAHGLNVRRPHPAIPRTDPNPRSSQNDNRILQLLAPTELVSTLSFLPDSTSLLLAGISHRWLRLFDLRAASTASATTVNASTNNSTSPISVTAKVQGIATDPFDTHRIATFGDGIVNVWDTRRLTSPLLTFSERDSAADGAWLRPGAVYSNIEFSSTRRGTLATMERDAAYVRFWDVLGTQPSSSLLTGGGPGGAGGDAVPERLVGKRSWATGLPWTGSGAGNAQPQQNHHQSLNQHHAQQPQTPPSKDHVEGWGSSVVLADTRRTKSFPRPLASFALVPSLLHSPHASAQTCNVMLANKDGDLELYAVSDAPKQAAWSSRGDLAFGAGRGCRVIPGFWEEEGDYPSHQHRNADDGEEEEEGRLVKRGGGGRSGSGGTVDDGQRRSREGPELGRGESSVGGEGSNSISIAADRDERGVSGSPPLFGRGDEDGFPALSRSGSASGGDTATIASHPGGRSGERESAEEGKGGTYSPSPLRNYTQRFGAGGSQDSGRRERSRSQKREQGGAESKGRGLIKLKAKGVDHIVQDDISMIMRRRAVRGYGLSKPQDNVALTHVDGEPSHGTTEILSELWAWLYYSQDFLCTPTPRIHGYDFSYEGLLGIWEGFPPLLSPNPQRQSQQLDKTPTPTGYRDLLDLPQPFPGSRRSGSPADDMHGNYLAALGALVGRARRAGEKDKWKPTVVTAKLAQRQVALRLLGWGLSDGEVTVAVKRWEKEGKLSRAACWLVFTRQYSKAVELLMRSDDEGHRLMSGTVAALVPHGTSKSSELREHCERLIVRLQDPYFRVILTHLALGDWSEVLEEEVLPFRERLAIAFQFLDDKALTSYLRRAAEHASSQGDIDALIVTGLTKPGMDVLQNYVDSTGDVQSAAILASYVVPTRFVDARVERWHDAYRDLLDGLKLFHQRVGFDIERGQRVHDAMQSGDVPVGEWVPRQILIRCNYCNKPVAAPPGAVAGSTGRPTACPNCNRALPRCSVCLMTLGIVQDAAREVELMHSHYKDTIDDAIVICQTCRHGGHASHILDWFYSKDGVWSRGVCPVADCDCRCMDEF